MVNLSNDFLFFSKPNPQASADKLMELVTRHIPEQLRMLQRNLLYTAITRARKLVVLVGSRQAI